MSKNHIAIDLDNQYCAQNYSPLPVTLVRGQGVHVWDADGKQYLDMMSAYSAVSHGHCHPELIACAQQQMKTLNVVSRAYHNDKLGEFLKLACQVTQQDKALPMNTGAEAVETAIKAARKWGYLHKGIAANEAEIIVCNNNFHGRTITIISMSTEAQYKAGFGPLTPGFKHVPFGDADALANAITDKTVAFLVEPMQGEAGMLLPPVGYLKACETICRERNVLLICDEIQTGLGRTGKLLAVQHEDVHPDGLILGKALGGGILPVSLFLSKAEVMNVFKPGDHGSTFGGNSLAAAVGQKALEILTRDKLADNAARLGEQFIQQLKTIQSPLVKEVRGKGLFIGIEIDPKQATAHDIVLRLLEKGILSKDTHETVVRIAPPLIITEAQLNEAFAMIKSCLE